MKDRMFCDADAIKTRTIVTDLHRRSHEAVGQSSLRVYLGLMLFHEKHKRWPTTYELRAILGYRSQMSISVEIRKLGRIGLLTYPLAGQGRGRGYMAMNTDYRLEMLSSPPVQDAPQEALAKVMP